MESSDVVRTVPLPKDRGCIAGSPVARPAVIAYRKACRPDGTGLSHYVLVTADSAQLKAANETNEE